MNHQICDIKLHTEEDLVVARQRAKKLATLANLPLSDQTRLVAAISEISRNALMYGKEGSVELSVTIDGGIQFISCRVSDQGPGIEKLDHVLSDKFSSKTGLGRGISGSRTLVDSFNIDSVVGTGTTVTMTKQIPASISRIEAEELSKWKEELIRETPINYHGMFRKQNEELLSTLSELNRYKGELEEQLAHVNELNSELEKTNLGILALYKELEEKEAVLVEKNRLLEEQGQELKRHSELKSEFLANMSHEIRTPMNGVLGMTELLLKSNLNERQHDYAATIYDAGKALLAVINDILDFSKIEAGKLVISNNDVEIARLVERVAELLATQADRKQLSLITFVDPEIPKYVKSDAGRLRQIVMNLANNAIKFSKDGEVIIRASLQSKSKEKVKIKFAVTDSGEGMTDEEAAKLFKPFVQLASSSEINGTGLGLNISKCLVELLGGEIGVHSVKNYGSTFWFVIEFDRTDQPEKDSLEIPDWSKKRILIVDDQATLRKIICDYVSSWGMRIDAAKDADEGLKLLKNASETDPYSVAIVDLLMPGTDGLVLGKRIREDNTINETKLVLITAFDKPGTGEEALTLGFDEYLTKPIRQSQLFDCLSNLITQKAVDDRKLEKQPESKMASQRLRPEFILIAEDHEVNQKVALLLLESLGFKADIAANGKKVLQRIEKVPYDLIFMDCQMPEMDGYETTRKIRELESKSGLHIPIIAMTAHAIEGSRDLCIAAGMDDYISKPIESEALKSMLHKWLPTTNRSIETPSKNEMDDCICSDPLNFAKLSENFGESNARELLNTFIKKIDSDMNSLVSAGDERHLQRIQELMHQYKSIFHMLCADSLSNMARSLENSALNPSPDWGEITHKIDLLVAESSKMKEQALRL